MGLKPQQRVLQRCHTTPTGSVFGDLLVLGLQSLERGDGDERDEGVELVRRVLVFVAATRQADANSERNTPTSEIPPISSTFSTEVRVSLLFYRRYTHYHVSCSFSLMVLE